MCLFLKLKMLTKKGERYLSPWWFFVLALIGAGIVGGVLMFYSAHIDLRSVEADILAGRVLDCLDSNGFVLTEYNTANFDIFKTCGFSRESFSSGNLFFFKVNLSDSSGNSVRVMSAGPMSFDKDCDVGASTKAKSYPVCATRTVSILYLDKGILKEGSLTVKAGSNQQGGRVGAI